MIFSCIKTEATTEIYMGQKKILKMIYYSNMSFKEISETCDISINTALGRMRYALINLRKMAEEKNLSLTLH